MKILMSLLIITLLAGCNINNASDQSAQTENKPAEETVDSNDENTEETASNESPDLFKPLEIIKDEHSNGSAGRL